MMTTRKSFYVHVFMAVMAALALAWAATVAAGPTENCQAAKLEASADKAKCLLKAEADSVKSGNPPNIATCVANFEATFAAAENDAGPGVCPTEGDVSAVETLIDTSVGDVAVALSGSPCQKFPATGQTDPFRAGDDGDIEAGATLSYTDNGDGTITDNNTGLTWEKKSDDGTIHDKDTSYSWENAFAVHVAGLNTANFAGHNDWRLPNVKELQSIVNYQVPFPGPVVSSAFNTGCTPGATVLAGSCCGATDYWSSTTDAFDSDFAWTVIFHFGEVDQEGKNQISHVRAVRGGL